MNQITNCLKIRYLITERLLKALPLPYTILLVMAYFVFFYVLYVIRLDFNKLNILLITSLFFGIQYVLNNESKAKLAFFSQYSKSAFAFKIIDFLVLIIPFSIVLNLKFIGLLLFLNMLQILYYKYIKLKMVNLHSFKTAILPSFFLKESYLWHSQSRPFLIIAWSLVLFLQIISVINNNYNLSIISFTLISFVSILRTILKHENQFFLRQFDNVKHFIASYSKELFINSILFIALPYSFLSIFFYNNFLISFISLILLFVGLYSTICIKYIFINEEVLMGLFLGLFIGMQIFLLLTIYLIPIALLFQFLLFKAFQASVNKIIL